MALIVKGTLTASPSGSTLSLSITGGNHFAKSLVTSPASTATVTTNSSTKVTKNGTSTTLSTLAQNDKLLVQYRVCKASMPKSTSDLTTLVARKVVALGSDKD